MIIIRSNKSEESAFARPMLNVYFNTSPTVAWSSRACASSVDVDIAMDISKGKYHSKLLASNGWWEPFDYLFYDRNKIVSISLDKLLKFSADMQRETIRYFVIKSIDNREEFNIITGERSIDIKVKVRDLEDMLHDIGLGKENPALRMSTPIEIIHRWQQGWWRELI